MGSLWRSQEMDMIQMIVQNDAAHVIIEALGKLGICEFRDVHRPQARTAEQTLYAPKHPTLLAQLTAAFRSQLNAGTSLYKRSFVDEVRKCEELARVMRTIQEEHNVQVCRPP